MVYFRSLLEAPSIYFSFERNLLLIRGYPLNESLGYSKRSSKYASSRSEKLILLLKRIISM